MISTTGIKYCLIIIYLRTLTAQFPTSPCPKIFTYEPNDLEINRWYGQLNLTSEAELEGVWIRINFDREPIQLGVKYFL